MIQQRSTADQFYRRATGLPFGVLITAGVFVAAARLLPDNRLLQSIGPFASVALIASAYAAVPYAVFLVIVWLWLRPSGEAAHRRIALVAPPCIGFPTAVVVSLWQGSSWPGIVTQFEVWLGGALAVGYAYVLSIEAVLSVSKTLGLVGPANSR